MTNLQVFLDNNGNLLLVYQVFGNTAKPNNIEYVHDDVFYWISQFKLSFKNGKTSLQKTTL